MVVVAANDSGSSETLDLVARVLFLCTVISSSSYVFRECANPSSSG